jgi:hypothetical protein
VLGGKNLVKEKDAKNLPFFISSKSLPYKRMQGPMTILILRLKGPIPFWHKCVFLIF